MARWTTDNRETWLRMAVEKMRPWLTEAGLAVPPIVHVSVGWPSRGALSRKRQRIGECWYGSCSGDGCPQLFISPVIKDSVEALATLLHEMLHTCFDPKVKHGPSFAKACVKVGLEGKPTATHAGAELKVKLGRLIGRIGPMPHAGITARGEERKQGTRLLKAEATECCGYIVRVTRKWVENEGAPLCPHGSTMTLE